MITCTKTGTEYTIGGLSAGDLELIQEAILHMFNVSNRPEHRSFRTEVLHINRAIDPAIEQEHLKFKTI